MILHRLIFSCLVGVVIVPPAALADEGGAVDPTFNCPAFTTCKQVCVANITECPLEMLCSSVNETLCPDGTCSESCDGHEESPCAFACAPVACNKVDNYYDVCQELYGSLYDAEVICGENEVQEVTELYTFTEPGFIICYVWFSVVPCLLLLWCAYNQRFSPVPGSCKNLALGLASSTKQSDNSRVAWQTGYKNHPIGTAMYCLTTLTVVGIYFLLSWLVFQYYIQQEAIEWWWVTGRFDDEVQVLLCFIAVWMYGFVFIFSLKFPYSIRSLHFRRCDLSEADFVAIGVKRLEIAETSITFSKDDMARMKRLFASFYGCVHGFMTFLFSDKNTFGCERLGETKFDILPVKTKKNGSKYITFEFRRYNLEKEVVGGVEESKFVPGYWNPGRTVGDIFGLETPEGLTEEEVKTRRDVIGRNRIEMKAPSFLRILYDELSTPFYTYQTFMVYSWIPLWYFYMAFTWGFVMIFGAVSVSIVQYKNERNLYRLTHITGKVKVIRNSTKHNISQDRLVPGDVIEVHPGVTYCDMVLVSSERTLVDESALTGEANPVGKSALDPLVANQEYNELSHKRNTIFAGTTILEADKSRAIVMKTASYTTRGELIRDIFAYRRQVFKFDTEIPIVVAILCMYACVGWGIAYYWAGEIFVYGWFYGIFVVAGCLPPLLPTVFTVSVGISDDRLAKKKITCTNSESILVAGKVTHAFFDKTGTITKQGLDFISAMDGSALVDDPKALSEERPVVNSTDALKMGMACCHNLDSSKTGEMVGNYVDRVMFTNSRGQLDDSGSELKITDINGTEVTVVRRFHFDHHRMTQSVIVRDTSNGMLAVFSKGSGEAIRKFCRTETIPENFESALKVAAKSGVYQLSMASKVLDEDTDVSNITREAVESDLNFQGVINFKNVIRENASEVISHLESGGISSTIVTGDNVLNGICIGYEAGILKNGKKVLVGFLEDDEVVWRTEDHVCVPLPPTKDLQNVQLAITGPAWQQIRGSDPKQANVLQDHIRVFGRCNPYDKVDVIQGFVKAGHVTLMSGDGGNDCGALKAAHVGVALSDAEASIVAPFTSLEKDIASVVSLVKEGRCALGSALASYKFIIMYGQIITINQLMAAYFYVTFSEWGWIFMDAAWTIPLSFALPLSKAAKHLAPTRPTASVLGLQTMSSAIGVLVINFIFVVIAFAALYHQDWFQCRMWENTDVSNLDVIGDNYETSVLFLVTGYQIVSAATVFNFGYEFRQAWIKNWVLVLLLAGFTAIHFYITLVPGEVSCFFRINCLNEYTFDGVWGIMPVQNDFNTTIIPETFRYVLIGIMVANTAATVSWDYLVVNGARKYFGKKKRAKKESVVGLEQSRNKLASEGRTLGPKGGRRGGSSTGSQGGSSTEIDLGKSPTWYSLVDTEEWC